MADAKATTRTAAKRAATTRTAAATPSCLRGCLALGVLHHTVQTAGRIKVKLGR